ncbi:MAG TPA: carboxymuconolactone decarboxylase family protein [Spirochaetia bacterium]|nr:carboxymuconolactone decarboxylase family protein [Spirochaetia bacterium]
MAYIEPPRRIPLILRLGIAIAERKTGRPMLAARLLAWFPRAALSSGILEALVAHGDRDVDARTLKLVRMQVSFAVSCPFCIDMNSFRYELKGITDEEVRALQGELEIGGVATFNARERAALLYTREACRTPLSFTPEVIGEVRSLFGERGMVILATTIGQVNFWARTIQALGVPPAGFGEQCSIEQRNLLKIERYSTLYAKADPADETRGQAGR